jgi:hypothetical protein
MRTVLFIATDGDVPYIVYVCNGTNRQCTVVHIDRYSAEILCVFVMERTDSVQLCI